MKGLIFTYFHPLPFDLENIPNKENTNIKDTNQIKSSVVY